MCVLCNVCIVQCVHYAMCSVCIVCIVCIVHCAGLWRSVAAVCMQALHCIELHCIAGCGVVSDKSDFCAAKWNLMLAAMWNLMAARLGKVKREISIQCTMGFQCTFKGI